MKKMPLAINESWAMDFVTDQLNNGKRIRALTVFDLFYRECLEIMWTRRSPARM